MKRTDHIVEEGWALYCVDGPRAGMIAGDGASCVRSVEVDYLEEMLASTDEMQKSHVIFLMRMNQCTAFRIGKYRIVEPID